MRRPAATPGRTLGLGVVGLWLSVIVLLPLAALTARAFEDGLAGFWEAVTAPVALAALAVTLGVSAVVALVNAVMGTLIAWVLVRDDFPGKRVVNALIDLPFALPTIVASIVLLSLYGPNSPVGLTLNATRWGLIVALAFVTLPFVVRSVQPVLLELDHEVEQAAASLGASNLTTFRRVVLPTLAPAVISGTGLAFARAVGEYGSVVLIGGNIPRETQSSPSTSSSRSRSTGRSTPPRSRSRCSASPSSPSSRCACGRADAAAGGEERMKTSRRATLTLRSVALLYLTALLAVPIAVILWRTFEPGIGPFLESIRTPAAIAALNLSLTIVAIVVPLNVVFGVVTAIALARWRCPSAASSRPSSTSPSRCRRSSSASRSSCCGASAGGSAACRSHRHPRHLRAPGMVVATIFVTLPFVVREVEPVLQEIGTEQEQAASTLGASRGRPSGGSRFLRSAGA